MPFSDVAALKDSDLFKRMKVLQDMSAARLRKFVSTFNAILARATRGGASEDEAEARAIPIALSAARQARSLPAGRVAEEKVHVYALMAKDMLHSGSVDGEVDTDLQFPDIEDLNAAFADTAFNNEHDALDPVGVLRRFASRDSLDAELQELVDPDIEVVALASFFEDVPEEERHATISPEWTTFQIGDGPVLAVPHTFAVTKTPANDAVLGIKQIAATTNPYEGDSTLSRSMGGEPEEMADLESKVASLSSELEKEREKHAKLEEQVASFDEVKQRLAALAGEKTDPEELDVKTVLASLDSRLKESSEKQASTEKRLEEIIQADREQKAAAFADDVFEKREVSAEGRDTWAALHLKDPEGADKLASTLPERVLAPGRQAAIENIKPLDDQGEKAFQDKMAAIMRERVS